MSNTYRFLLSPLFPMRSFHSFAAPLYMFQKTIDAIDRPVVGARAAVLRDHHDRFHTQLNAPESCTRQQARLCVSEHMRNDLFARNDTAERRWTAAPQQASGSVAQS